MGTGSPYKFPICYSVVGSYSFRNQGKVLMSGFRDRFAYKSPYIVALFRYTHCIPSGNNMTTSDLSHLRGTLIRRDRSLPKGNVADGQTWERRIFPCKEVSVSPMVWKLSAICEALLRQRFIAALML